MLRLTEVLISTVSERVAADYDALYPHEQPERLALATAMVRTAIEKIATSDALYHNAEHTALVTLVGLEILRCKQHAEGTVTPAEWSNTVIALLCHDIGYVRALCRNDTRTLLTTGTGGPPFRKFSGSSDAVLMPIHVNRGKRFVEEQFLGNELVDIGFVQACVERTRFPVPNEPWYAETSDFPGLVRAADLIGQLSDPRYLSKLAAIFFEFEETGFNRTTGYKNPGDLLAAYPTFFDRSVLPYIGDATRYLECSAAGREILTHLYANLATARDADADLPLTAANS